MAYACVLTGTCPLWRMRGWLAGRSAGSMRRLRAVFDDLDSDRDGAFTLPEVRPPMMMMLPAAAVHA